MNAHDSLDEISSGLRDMGTEIQAAGIALEAAETVIADAGMKVAALFVRRREIAEQVRILQEVLGLQ